MDKPKLVMFIDEAHLIFNEASSALLQQIETIVKLIRSKGIGVFFCTQNPMDVPASVLAQLGLKIQHALRAFTAADRKVKIIGTFPEGSHKPIVYPAAITSEAKDDDAGAFGNEAFGTAQANATGRASDDGDSVLEFHACLLMGVEIAAV